eukprot:TRINITY_DN3103_c2_g1_i1.p1 TRINITY_DN3103_c2_g1~~TRINITY_DN3103_c2_g1_i1.p1  ORF type:complete len:129 (-),score=25.45 TRINITY_DN3103_c2_g1_i1:11-397(-)
MLLWLMTTPFGFPPPPLWSPLDLEEGGVSFVRYLGGNECRGALQVLPRNSSSVTHRRASWRQFCSSGCCPVCALCVVLWYGVGGDEEAGGRRTLAVVVAVGSTATCHRTPTPHPHPRHTHAHAPRTLR